MRSKTWIFSFLVLSGACDGLAQPLATAHMSSSGGSWGVTGLTLQVGYGGGSNNVVLFDNVLWTPGNVGQSVSAPGGLAYNNFVALLTDGVNESTGWRCTLRPGGGGAAVTRPESTFFTTHPADWNGVDLQGYAIGDIELQMNTLSLQTSGGWTTYSWDALLTIYAVPEPATAALLLVAGLGAWLVTAARIPPGWARGVGKPGGGALMAHNRGQ